MVEVYLLIFQEDSQKNIDHTPPLDGYDELLVLQLQCLLLVFFQEEGVILGGVQ